MLSWGLDKEANASPAFFKGISNAPQEKINENFKLSRYDLRTQLLLYSSTLGDHICIFHNSRKNQKKSSDTDLQPLLRRTPIRTNVSTRWNIKSNKSWNLCSSEREEFSNFTPINPPTLSPLAFYDFHTVLYFTKMSSL